MQTTPVLIWSIGYFLGILSVGFVVLGIQMSRRLSGDLKLWVWEYAIGLGLLAIRWLLRAALEVGHREAPMALVVIVGLTGTVLLVAPGLHPGIRFIVARR